MNELTFQGKPYFFSIVSIVSRLGFLSHISWLSQVSGSLPDILTMRCLLVIISNFTYCSHPPPLSRGTAPLCTKRHSSTQQSIHQATMLQRVCCLDSLCKVPTKKSGNVKTLTHYLVCGPYIVLIGYRPT